MMKNWIWVMGIIIPIAITIIFRLSSQSIELFAWTIFILIFLVALGILVFIGIISYQKYRILKAQADAEELKSTLIQSGNDTWVKEVINYELPNGEKQQTIEYARLGGIRLRVNGHDHKPTESELLFASTQQTTSQTKMITSGVVSMPAQIDLLPLLDKAERVLIKGASDAGKTTLLQHIASRSKGIIIIDPHFAPGVWPVKDIQIIGAGRNYKAIDKFLNRLMVELNERYQKRAQGQTEFKTITLILDEFQSIKEECKNAGKILSTLIRESRKVGFRLFIGSHSELVKSLGLEGQGDIREGMFIVRLSIDQITKKRICKIDRGYNEEDCYIPPFNSEVKVPDLILDPKETLILDLAKAGKSYNEIARQVYGNIGGYQTKLIKEVIQRNNL